MRPVVSVAPRGSIAGRYSSYWDSFVESIIDARLGLRVDPALASPCWSAFEFRVGETLCVWDFSDYILIEAEHARYKHWFRRKLTSGHLAWGHLHDLNVLVGGDWKSLRLIRDRGRYQASGDQILHRQKIVDEPTNRPDADLSRRRLQARHLLQAAFGARVDTSISSQADFYQAALQCLVSVHIPGTWAHQVDRGIQECWCLGVCTISPDLHCLMCARRVEPWEHYVPIRDDYSDLPDKVRWCESHRSECVAIGQRAQAFFSCHLEPAAVWRHALRCLE